MVRDTKLKKRWCQGALGDSEGFLDWNFPLENIDDKQQKKTNTVVPLPMSFPFPGLKFSLFQIWKSYLEHMFLLSNTFPPNPQKLLYSLNSAAVCFSLIKCSCCLLASYVLVLWHHGIILLQKPVMEKPSATLGELENSGLLCQRAQRSWRSKLWASNKGVTEFL